jgi:hypothetical protein
MGTKLELMPLSLINREIQHVGNLNAFDSMKDYIPQNLT